MNKTDHEKFIESVKKVTDSTQTLLEKQDEVRIAQKAADEALVEHERLIPTLKTV